VQQVDRDTLDAARGVGLNGAQVMWRIELPLAMPTIFSGLRTSAVAVVATATIAPLSDVETLGVPIINSNIYGFDGQLGAAILVALITIAVDLTLAGLERAFTPRGLKLVAAQSTPQRRPSLTKLLRRRPETV
jgi:osmoprotectant transport system permease protein